MDKNLFCSRKDCRDPGYSNPKCWALSWLLAASFLYYGSELANRFSFVRHRGYHRLLLAVRLSLQVDRSQRPKDWSGLYSICSPHFGAFEPPCSLISSSDGLPRIFALFIPHLQYFGHWQGSHRPTGKHRRVRRLGSFCWLIGLSICRCNDSRDFVVLQSFTTESWRPWFLRKQVFWSLQRPSAIPCRSNVSWLLALSANIQNASD